MCAKLFYSQPFFLRKKPRKNRSQGLELGFINSSHFPGLSFPYYENIESPKIKILGQLRLHMYRQGKDFTEEGSQLNQQLLKVEDTIPCASTALSSIYARDFIYTDYSPQQLPLMSTEGMDLNCYNCYTNFSLSCSVQINKSRNLKTAVMNPHMDDSC